MSIDSPRVAFNNDIKQAVITRGQKINDINTIFNGDNANGFILRTDITGQSTIELKVNQNKHDSFVFGNHRYDLSGQTVDFTFDLQGHDGAGYTSIVAGNFVSKKESLYKALPAHTLGLPTSTQIISGIPDVLKKVVWSGSQYVGIGVLASTLYMSVDGVTWVKDNTVPAGTINDVKAIADKIVICGNAGYFAFYDGTSWTVKVVTTANLNGVTTNFNQFVVVGTNNEIWQSTDLINFTQVTSPAPAGTVWDGIDNVNFAFILRNQLGVYVSFDNLVTLSAPSGLTGIRDSVVVGSDYYVCGDAGLVAKSVDFVNFTQISVGNTKNVTLSVTDSEIVVVDINSLIRVSYDNGLTYSTLTYQNQNGVVSDIASNGVDFIISNSVDVELFFLSYKYRFLISGLTVNSDFLVPEIFIGDSVTIGHVNYGTDPESLRSGIKKFNSENGRVVENILYRRLELSFGLDVIDSARVVDIKLFRDYIYSTRSPIWFMFKPDTDGYATYLMKVDGDIDLPIHSPVHRSSAIKFIEYV